MNVIDLPLKGQLEIELRDTIIAYGRTPALEIPQLKVGGRIIAVIGHNGSGKSTLLKALLKLLLPRQGSIDCYWNDHNRRTELVPEVHMAFSPENGAVFEDLPVESYVQLWCRIKQRDKKYYRKAGSKVIEMLDIAPLFRKLGRELSKGQRRRVQSAVGFLSNPKLFLFDEPFDGLDIMQSTELAGIMLENSKRMAMIVSSHRMDVVERIADMVIVLRDGKLHSFGSVEEVCSLLCGSGIIISKDSNHHIGFESLELQLRAEFYSCLVSRIGQQLLITGSDVTVDAVASFLSQHQVTGIKLAPIRPSLVDAMRYHLHRLH